MFWRFTLPSKIDSLLEKEEICLMELLDEDDVLQECKGQNQRLLEFLTQDESMNKLVDLIVMQPDDETDERRRYKFPNTACELLTSDVAQITNMLVDGDIYLERLYKFLNTNDSLNPLLASFVGRVFCLLITRKSESTLNFVKSKLNFMDLLLKHLETSAICELLTQFITCSSSFAASNSFPDIGEDCVKQCRSWLIDLNLIEKLVNLIHPDYSCYIHANASGVIMEIIKLHREFLSAKLKGDEVSDEDDLIAKQAESSACINKLLHNMLSWRRNVDTTSTPDEEERRNSALVHGFSILLTLVDPKACAPSNSGPIMNDQIMSGLPGEIISNSTDNGRSADDILTFDVTESVEGIVQHLPDIHQLLLNPPKQHYSTMNTTIGLLDPPLGQIRLAVVRLLATILERAPSEKINEKLVELKTQQVLLELFFHYTWNNLLHTQVEKCIAAILNATQGLTEGTGTFKLVEQLFSSNQCSLVSKILWAFEMDARREVNTRRAGYMGHLTKIANHVTTVSHNLGAARVNGGDSLNGTDVDSVPETPRDPKPTEEKSELSISTGSDEKAFWSDWIDQSAREDWDKFVTGTLESVNTKNIITPVRQGNMGLPSSSEDGDDDFKQVNFPSDTGLQQAFSDYQLQQMTSNFVDNFGFEQSDFAKTGQKPESMYTENVNSIDFGSVEDCSPQSSRTLFDKIVNKKMNIIDDEDDDDDKNAWNHVEEVEVRAAPHALSATLCHSSDEEDDCDEKRPKKSSSSDSSEDLDSPQVIRHTEIMDVEKEETFTKATDMDTTPWKDDACQSPSEDSSNWANFDSIEESNNEKKEGWADFRKISDVPMENADLKVETARVSAYVLSEDSERNDEVKEKENPQGFLSNSGLMKYEEAAEQASTAENAPCNGSAT
ncbi:DgyrCDS5910 [Dimorphilus gyrociliatus]|uniref:DgyrCDS5910 n=1 Tax=Dimorphilus gyrociliatus TaxID=2664684 RepID=A0A7I8VLI4_9ANNE|nr:DgyrCDS5910 [Dimorphilus gyrociliatus]